MKVRNNPNPLTNHFVHLHGQDWLAKQRIAGKCVSNVMGYLCDLVQSGEERNLLKLDKIADTKIREYFDCIPTFLHFKGFPNSVCMSVNKQLVHGVPTDYTLKDGDFITFDFGATYEGAIADSAKTIEVGATTKAPIIKAGEECLYNAIKAMKIGLKTGVIGYAIDRTAKKLGFNVIDRYGGHSIDWNKPHAGIFISNKSLPDEGIRIQPGLTIAIEPLLVPGNCSTETVTDPTDKWTVTTNSISHHVEHSLYVHPDRIEIITWRAEEAQSIPNEILF